MVKRKINWTPQEDQKLASLVNGNNRINWEYIAEQMGTKTSKQCKYRWENPSSQSTSKIKWKKHQINLIFQQHKELGSKWTQIAEVLKERTANQIKNKFNNTLRKGLRKIGKIGQQVRNSTKIVKKMKSKRIQDLLNDNAKIRGYGFDRDTIHDILYECSKKKQKQQQDHRARQLQPQKKRQYASLFEMFQRQCVEPESQQQLQQRNTRVVRIGSKTKNKGLKKPSSLYTSTSLSRSRRSTQGTSQSSQSVIQTPTAIIGFNTIMNTSSVTDTTPDIVRTTPVTNTTQNRRNNQTQPVINQRQVQHNMEQFDQYQSQLRDRIYPMNSLFQQGQRQISYASFRQASESSIFAQVPDRQSSQMLLRSLGKSGAQTQKMSRCMQQKNNQPVQPDQDLLQNFRGQKNIY